MLIYMGMFVHEVFLLLFYTAVRTWVAEAAEQHFILHSQKNSVCELGYIPPFIIEHLGATNTTSYKLAY